MAINGRRRHDARRCLGARCRSSNSPIVVVTKLIKTARHGVADALNARGFTQSVGPAAPDDRQVYLYAGQV